MKHSDANHPDANHLGGNNPGEHLAWLLAAEDHPHLKKEEGYLEAKAQLDHSPEMQTHFHEALAFTQKHPALFAFNTMPHDVRLRIAEKLQQAASELANPQSLGPQALRPHTSRKPAVTPSPWTYRQQFAWAAVLALFLAGLSVISSKVIEQQSSYASSPQLARTPPPQQGLPAFHRFVQASLQESPQIQHQASETVQLVSWLADHEGFAPPLPEAITRSKGMGCSVLESPQGKISMICVDVNGQMLKLFIACSKQLGTQPIEARALKIDRHEALEWIDEDNTFLLIQSLPDVPMPEIML